MKTLIVLKKCVTTLKGYYFKSEKYLIVLLVGTLSLSAIVSACTGQGCRADYIVTENALIPAFRGECRDGELYKNDRDGSKWLDDSGQTIVCDGIVNLSEKEASDASIVFKLRNGLGG